MNDTSVVEIAISAMILTAKLTGPFLAMSLSVGFAVSLFQSVTQVQEVTLTFVPKLVGVGMVLAVGGNWMLSELVTYTTELFDVIPTLLNAS